MPARRIGMGTRSAAVAHSSVRSHEPGIAGQTALRDGTRNAIENAETQYSVLPTHNVPRPVLRPGDGAPAATAATAEALLRVMTPGYGMKSQANGERRTPRGVDGVASDFPRLDGHKHGTGGDFFPPDIDSFLAAPAPEWAGMPQNSAVAEW